mmetsp:Transcript_21599/g.48096  ORF Transcript_21599/g.48096 Transcript_21599/m.48096 type:complete len:216 (-) Transcript_21599:880-1527(-)
MKGESIDARMRRSSITCLNCPVSMTAILDRDFNAHCMGTVSLVALYSAKVTTPKEPEPRMYFCLKRDESKEISFVLAASLASSCFFVSRLSCAPRTFSAGPKRFSNTSTENARTVISSIAVRVRGDTAPSFTPPAAGIHGQQLFIFALPLKAPMPIMQPSYTSQRVSGCGGTVGVCSVNSDSSSPPVAMNFPSCSADITPTDLRFPALGRTIFIA